LRAELSVSRTSPRFAGLRFLHLGKCQRDDAIAHLGPHLVLIDPARNPEAPPVGIDIVFAVNRLQPVVIDSTFDGEQTVSAGLLLSAGTGSPRTKLFVTLGVLRSYRLRVRCRTKWRLSG
jgi:hypothetical protein